MLPRALHIRHFEVVHRELLLVRQPHVTILYFPARLLSADHWIARPHDVVDRIYVLQKSAQPLQTVREFDGNGIEVHAATLLEVSELRDLKPVEHHLPPDAPRAQRRRLPVVLDRKSTRLNSSH